MYRILAWVLKTHILHLTGSTYWMACMTEFLTLVNLRFQISIVSLNTNLCKIISTSHHDELVSVCLFNYFEHFHLIWFLIVPFHSVDVIICVFVYLFFNKFLENTLTDVLHQTATWATNSEGTSSLRYLYSFKPFPNQYWNATVTNSRGTQGKALPNEMERHHHIFLPQPVERAVKFFRHSYQL